MSIGITCDHAGRDVSLTLAMKLREDGHDVVYLGPDTPDSVDYPDFAEALARAVAGGEHERGIAICGTGIGMAMAANKIAGIRAAVVHDEYTAKMAREHNNANVLCLGARVLENNVIRMAKLARLFLATDFGGGRHAPRVAKINALDSEQASTSHD